METDPEYKRESEREMNIINIVQMNMKNHSIRLMTIEVNDSFILY